MSLDHFFDAADETILRGCQYVVIKANDFLGWNKYTFARGADSISFLGLEYFAVASSINPLSLLLGVFGIGQGLYTIKENKEREQLEESLDEGVISLELADKIGGDTEFRFLELMIGIMAGSCISLAQNALPVTLPFLYGSSIGLCGHALGHYFMSCEYLPKKRGKIFEMIRSLDVVPQEVTIRK